MKTQEVTGHEICCLQMRLRNETLEFTMAYNQLSWSEKPDRITSSNLNTMFLVFFDHRGVNHIELKPLGQTMNTQFDVKVHSCSRKPHITSL